MNLTPDQKFEILKVEMQLIQNSLNKFDDMQFRNRNWFVTLWLGLIGLSFSVLNPLMPLLGVMLAFLYWFSEGIFRYSNSYRNVVRYREIRDSLRMKEFSLESFDVYDLTNKFGRNKPGMFRKIFDCFIRIESIFIYLIIIAASIAIHFIILSLAKS